MGRKLTDTNQPENCRNQKGIEKDQVEDTVHFVTRLL